MAKIYWRKGRASARATIDGVEYRRALETASPREAEVRFQEWLGEIRGSKRRAPWDRHEATLQRAVDVHCDSHLATLREGTQERYIQSIGFLIEHFGADRTLQSIAHADLAGFVTWRRKGARKNRVSSSTIRRDLACLSSIYTIAIDNGLAEVNPVQPFLRSQRRGKKLVESDPRTRYLTHAEEEAVLTEALRQATNPESIRRKEKAMIAAAIALYIDFGLRAQELLHARHSWIDLDRNELTVPADVAKSGTARVIPLNDRARRIVEMLPKNGQTDLLLWRCDAGKQFSDLNKAFQRIAKDAGVEDVHIHDLRRTCGCRLLQDRAARMEEVSKWLGHASISMTERAYAFLSVGNLHALVGSVQDRSARDRIDAMFEASSLDVLVGIEVEQKLLESA